MPDAASDAPAFTPFPQGAAYAQAAAACGAVVRRIDLGCGTAQVLERRGRRMVLRGPLWHGAVPLAERRRALRRLARFAGLTIATPEEDIRGPGLVPLVTPVHQAIWHLAGDLRAGMAGKWRNRLVAAERAGEGVRRGAAGVLPRLVQLEAGQRLARGYRALPPEFTRALPVPALRLWEWRHEGQLAAAMLFVVDGASAFWHLAWACDAARRRGIPTLMLTRAAESLREEGVRWLDLGSVNSEQAPGLVRFKLGTGAALKRLGSSLLVLPG